MRRGRRDGRIAHDGPPSLARSLVSVPYPLRWRTLGFPKQRNWQFIGGGSSLESARDGASHAGLTLEMPKMLARTKCRLHMPWDEGFSTVSYSCHQNPTVRGLLTSSRHSSSISKGELQEEHGSTILYTVGHHCSSHHESSPTRAGIPRWDICCLACFTATDDDHAVKTDKQSRHLHSIASGIRNSLPENANRGHFRVPRTWLPS